MSGLLIPNTFDPKGKTIQTVGINGSTSTSYVTVLSITGSGYLQTLNFNSTSGNYWIQITLDGIVILEQTCGQTDTSFSLTPIFPFATSLLVRVKVEATTHTVFGAACALVD